MLSKETEDGIREINNKDSRKEPRSRLLGFLWPEQEKDTDKDYTANSGLKDARDNCTALSSTELSLDLVARKRLA